MASVVSERDDFDSLCHDAVNNRVSLQYPLAHTGTLVARASSSNIRHVFQPVKRVENLLGKRFGIDKRDIAEIL